MPFVRAKDLHIHYLDQGAGTPIVFVHGNWVTAACWEPVLARLPAGYRGLAYDLRGRGQTRGPGHEYSMPEMAADLLAFVDALVLDRFHLVGHSLGSAVAMQFGLEHGQRLVSLTALAPAWVDGMPAAYNAPDGQKALKANKAYFAGALKMMAPKAPVDDLWARLVEEGFQQDEAATLKNLPALLNWKPGDALRAISAPKLVVVGEHDPLCGGPNAVRAAQALGARHVVIAGVGHSPNLEAPDEFVRILTESYTTPKETIMTTVPTLPGIRSDMIQTRRIRTHALFSGPATGVPVVFVHGNITSATYWEDIMLRLPARYRGIAPDLRGYGETEDLVVDATRGARDWADDLKALSDALGPRPAHLVGWSLGGAAILQFAIDHPELVASLTLYNPVGPYGYGGTKDANGTPCYADYAGSGGAMFAPELIQRMKDGDRGETPMSPRSLLNGNLYVPPFRHPREEDFLSAALLTKLGADRFPGDMTPSTNWPMFAPGAHGPWNAITPKYLNLSGIADIKNKPPILWISGALDAGASDTSAYDLASLGRAGIVPGWPGDTVFPNQPTVSQTHAVLKRYAANGGQYREVVMEGAAHGAHLQKPEEFTAILLGFLDEHPAG